jgi:uncharacterized protein (TIGR03118 family)
MERAGAQRRFWAVSAALAATLLAVAALAAVASAGGDRDYTVTNLVSDQDGVAVQPADPTLVNGWGLAALPTSPWWVAANGTDAATVYLANGATARPPVTVPGAPTGEVANSGPNFAVGPDAPARFIFATEDGTILGWNPSVAPNDAVVAVPNTTGAIYKGLAIASTTAGDFLYATDFHNGRVDVFDGSYQPVGAPSAFTDPSLPDGFAPFGIQNVDGTIVVTYAKQDDEQEDEIAGQGLGFVDAYDTSGNLIARIAQHGQLNAPWGIAKAPDEGFGRFSGDLLVGNFGDGQITAFEQTSSGDWVPRGQLRSDGGHVLSIDGLWALEFGLGDPKNGSPSTLFFTAGPGDEHHGLFGTVTAG